jgi:hypothetical protein
MTVVSEPVEPGTVEATAAVEPRLRLLAAEERSRAMRGLTTPNLPRTYRPSERASRGPLFRHLRHAVERGEEANLPLWLFLGASAVARVDSRRHELEGRRFWQQWQTGINSAPDECVASVVGLKSRDIFEARLSRQAFVHVLDCLDGMYLERLECDLNDDLADAVCEMVEETPEIPADLYELALSGGWELVNEVHFKIIRLACFIHLMVLQQAGIQPPQASLADVLASA